MITNITFQRKNTYHHIKIWWFSLYDACLQPLKFANLSADQVKTQIELRAHITNVTLIATVPVTPVPKAFAI